MAAAVLRGGMTTAVRGSGSASISGRGVGGGSERLGPSSEVAGARRSPSHRSHGRASRLDVSAKKASKTFGGKKSGGSGGGGGGGGGDSGGGSGGGGVTRQPVPSKSAPQRITGPTKNLSVGRQIRLIEKFKSAGSPQGGGGGGNSGGLTKPATIDRVGFRKTKDDAYNEELARRRAAKQAEARHLDNLKGKAR